jgi:hypothetical protein
MALRISRTAHRAGELYKALTRQETKTKILARYDLALPNVCYRFQIEQRPPHRDMANNAPEPARPGMKNPSTRWNNNPPQSRCSLNTNQFPLASIGQSAEIFPLSPIESKSSSQQKHLISIVPPDDEERALGLFVSEVFPEAKGRQYEALLKHEFEIYKKSRTEGVKNVQEYIMMLKNLKKQHEKSRKLKKKNKSSSKTQKSNKKRK